MSFEITSIKTHAEAPTHDKNLQEIRQWAEVTISITKDFDFQANGAAVLKKLQAAADLIGRGE